MTPGIIVALDLPTPDESLALVDRLGDAVDYYKVGVPLYLTGGPALVSELKDRGKRVFLDMKLHDIPSTVARAVRAAVALDADMVTLHVSGGPEMMRAAREAAGDAATRLLGVTILTSSHASEVERVWAKEVRSIRDEVDRLASLAAESSLDGVVASPLEAEAIKRRHGPLFLVVTPGVRPGGAAAADQSRTATPLAAARAGADFLVIGRPILEAEDPAAAVDAIIDEISGFKAPAG